MSLPTYATGTVSVGAAGTVVTGTGGVWTGTNAKQGDFISINSSAAVLITEVTDATHLKIAPWPGAAQSGVPYVIYQNYVGRVVGVAAAEDVGTMLEKLHTDGIPFIVSPSETVPDPSYGDEGQLAFQPSTGKWWQKTGGAWVPSASLSSDNTKVAKAGDTMTGALAIRMPPGVGVPLTVSADAMFLVLQSQGAASGKKSLNLYYDGAVNLTAPGLIWQNYNDAGTGFVANGGVLWRDGGASFGNIIYPGAGSVSISNNLTVGPGGTGTLPAILMTLNGSSGSGGGFRQFWQKNGAVKWQVGFANSMLGTGTSDDFKIMDQASGNAITIASGSGNINVTSAAASTSASTGALTVAGGIGCGGAITGAGIGVGQPFGAAGANINAIAGVNAGGYIMGIQNLHGAVGDAALLIGAGSGTATDAGSVLIDFRSPNYGVICGTIARNGTQSVAYNTSSDLRGKPNREPLSLDYARSIVDALKIWDFDKDGNAIRGLGVIAQEAYAVHKSLAQPGLKPETWWQAEKAAPVPFLVANMQQLNRRIDQLEAEIAELKLQRK